MWASHRHALEMNGNWPERALQSLAAKILGSEGLKMPPDVKCSAGAEAIRWVALYWHVNQIKPSPDINHCLC